MCQKMLEMGRELVLGEEINNILRGEIDKRNVVKKLKWCEICATHIRFVLLGLHCCSDKFLAPQIMLAMLKNICSANTAQEFK